MIFATNINHVKPANLAKSLVSDRGSFAAKTGKKKKGSRLSSRSLPGEGWAGVAKDVLLFLSRRLPRGGELNDVAGDCESSRRRTGLRGREGDLDFAPGALLPERRT